MKCLLQVLVVLLSLVGCSEQKEGNDSTIDVAETAPSPPQEELPEPGTLQPSAEVSEEAVEVESPVPASGVVVADRKFIKTGRIAFDTDNPIATRKKIMASVRANHAYVSRDDEERSGDQITYTIVVHVPAARFDTFLNSATVGIARFHEKSISNEEVTARFIDTESRLKTKKDIENGYRALLSKASSVKDILEIERELGEIRTDIEAVEAQFRQLNGDIKYSTLDLVFYESIETASPFLSELADAFEIGVANLRALTLVLVAAWPFMLLAIGVIAALGWWRRKSNGQKQEMAE